MSDTRRFDHIRATNSYRTSYRDTWIGCVTGQILYASHWLDLAEDTPTSCWYRPTVTSSGTASDDVTDVECCCCRLEYQPLDEHVANFL